MNELQKSKFNFNFKLIFGDGFKYKHTLLRYIMESPVQTRYPEGQIIMNTTRRSHHRTDSTGGKIVHSPGRLNTVPCIHRRSSDSDLSITPKGRSIYNTKF